MYVTWWLVILLILDMTSYCCYSKASLSVDIFLNYKSTKVPIILYYPDSVLDFFVTDLVQFSTAVKVVNIIPHYL